MKPLNTDDALCPQYYKDERCKEMERAAADKQCILASKKEADERVEAMACKIAALKVIFFILKDITIECHMLMDVMF